jgi:hypothetical protein
MGGRTSSTTRPQDEDWAAWYAGYLVAEQGRDGPRRGAIGVTRGRPVGPGGGTTVPANGSSVSGG